jgi:hypothetical protein
LLPFWASLHGYAATTNDEFDTLPHIILTSDDTWDPSSLDDEFSINDLILDAPAHLEDQDTRVTPLGEYLVNTPATLMRISV